MDATLCILAGGESRRMGRAKAELLVRGQPMLAYLIERFRWPGPTMLVTSPLRRSPPGAERFDREEVDPVAGEGPLRGVCTALSCVQTPRILFVTVDMPLVTREQCQWLVNQLASTGQYGLMLRHDDHVQPFPSIFHRNAVGRVRARFDGGERSVVALANEEFVEVRDAPADWPESVWTNVNTPDDFDRFVHALDAD